MQLLREYADHGTEEAFTILVSRHLAMVYHAALRQTRQSELAEEIVQTVFTLLARKANRISANALLSGWLFNTARFVSTRTVRDEMRRQRRQAEAARMNLNAASPEPPAPEEQLLPLLDDLLARLPNRDREAVLARYLEGKSFVEVASAAGTTEEAAKKRVQRALEKMRGMLEARGVAGSVAALAAGLEAAKAQALPAGLSAAAVSSVALKGASDSVALSVLTRTTLEVMKWTKIKVAGATALAIALGVATTHYCLSRHAQAAGGGVRPVNSPANPRPLATLREAADRLRAENAQLAAALAAAEAKKTQLEMASREAERATRESKAIAARNLTPTNGAPTRQDVFVSLGRLMKLSALDATKLSPDERKAARATATQETLRLLQAAGQSGQLDLLDLDGEFTPSSPEEAAELETCVLHGILELSPQQRTQVQEALTKYEKQAAQANPQHKLALDDPETWDAALEPVENLLSDAQLELLKQVMEKATVVVTNGPARPPPPNR